VGPVKDRLAANFARALMDKNLIGNRALGLTTGSVMPVTGATGSPVQIAPSHLSHAAKPSEIIPQMGLHAPCPDGGK
jgi:hypothetical protein